MTLSQTIKLKTDSGGDIVDFLVDVMQDQYKDFRICHRLQAARLLTTYGNEDAPNFIAETTPDSSPRRDRPNSKRQTKFDTELARLIREDTDDGRSIARFLVNVMVGELRSFRPHHRMAAACELLNRGFGKSAHTDPEPERPARTEPIEASEPTEAPPLTPQTITNRRSGEGRNPETPPPGDAQPAHTDPEPERPARTPIRHSRERTACPVLDTGSPRTPIRGGNPPGGSPLGHPGAGDPLTPHSSPLTPQREAPPLTPHSSPLTPQDADGLSIDTLHHIPPQHFEHTVLDLLENMGYGHARHVGRTGDGDIDGIIDQDTLGLKRLYVQAKRWTNQVGEPEIRNFSGSLDAHGATRGILITTSDFTDTARKNRQDHLHRNQAHPPGQRPRARPPHTPPQHPSHTRHPPTFPKAGQRPPHPPHLAGLRHSPLGLRACPVSRDGGRG